MIQQFQLQPDQLAQRVEQHTAKGVFTRGVVAEPYLRIFHLKSGTLVEIHQGGRIDLGALWDKLQSLPFSGKPPLLLLSGGDFILDWYFYKVLLKEGPRIDLALQIRVQINQPDMFLRNVMPTAASIEIGDLKGRYYNELANLVSAQFATIGVSSLVASSQWQEQLLVALERHLHITLGRDGILLLQINLVQISNPELAQFTQSQVALRLPVRRNPLMNEQERMRYEQQGARARMSFGYDHQSGSLKLQAQLLQGAHYQRRSRLWARIRQALLQKNVEEVAHERALEAFIRQVDQEELLQQADYAKLQEELRWAAQDRILARQHLLARLNAEQEHEMRIMELLQQQEVDESTLIYKIAQERRILEDQLVTTRMRNEATREQEKVQALHQRRQQLEAHLHQLELEKIKKMAQGAQTMTEGRLNQELERIAITIAHTKLEIKRIKANESLGRELRRQKERQALALAAAEKRMRLRVAENWRQHKMDMQAQKLILQHDLEEGKLTCDALPLSADLPRTPEVAKAHLEQAFQDAPRIQPRRDKADEHYIRREHQPQQEVMAPKGKMGAASVTSTAASALSLPLQEKICSNCRVWNQRQARFCFNCGHPLGPERASVS